MNSFYRNWHRAAYWARAKRKLLSDTWRPRVSKAIGFPSMTEITFVDEFGEEISFTLTDEHARALSEQLNNKLNTQHAH